VQTPDAAALRDALARLRAAGASLRRRPRSERVGSLGRVLERFGDPHSGERRELEAKLPEATGFAPATLRAGLDLALAGWTSRALFALVDDELERAGKARVATGFPATAVLLGGAVPTPTLLALVAPLVLGSPVLARVSSHDPLTARVFARALAAEDDDLGAALQVVSFPSDDADAMAALLSAECVVAYGSDATMQAVTARTTPTQRLVRHGHRLSVAVLGEGALSGDALERAADALALDVALWDQQGCLSPVALYVLGAERVSSALLDRLCAAFERAAARLPRGRLDARAAAELAHERDTVELRAAADPALALRAGSAFTLVAEPDARFRGSPLQRFLRIHPVVGPEPLLEALAPLAPHLAAVGCAGLGSLAGRLGPELAALGASRICPLGTMQAPPLAWCHDQQAVLLPLARLADIE
jgi:acyl-CoA reductase-like NAD-dependent aldehyde dehydrogenase